MPSMQRSRSRSERHVSTIPAVNNTLGGGPHPQGDDNRQNQGVQENQNARPSVRN
jgi:hypothetical protein